MGSTDKGNPGAPRLAGLEEPVRMGFSERPCLERKKKRRWSMTEEGVLMSVF